MAKEITLNIGKIILEMLQTPLRKREEVILLLLNTIRMFYLNSNFKDNKDEKVIISIKKMNRIFYILKDKIFSIHFPFFIDNNENNLRFYHNITGINMDFYILSFLIQAFEEMNRKENNIDFDIIFDIVMESEIVKNGYHTTKEIWLLISHLLKFDYGYLRYDNDTKHENGKLHPLHHLDISLDSSATFKIGLNNKIDFSDFKDILDTTTDCWYIQKK